MTAVKLDVTNSIREYGSEKQHAVIDGEKVCLCVHKARSFINEHILAGHEPAEQAGHEVLEAVFERRREQVLA